MADLKCIRVFLAVARTEGFTAAADELGISKAACSKHVARLEGQLGVRLLNRSTRNVRLTEAGIAYRDRMREILAEIEETEAAVAQLNTQPRGQLRLMAPTSYGSFHLARAITAYQARFPDVNVDLLLADRPPDLINDGLDLAIQVGELADSNCVARILARVRVVVCGAPSYFERAGEPRSLRDLQRHNCLVYSARHPAGVWQFRAGGRQQQVVVSGTFRSSAGEALRIAAVEGRGLVQLPTYMVGLDIQAGRLQPVLEVFEPEPRPISALFLHRRYLSAKVRTFVDFMQERYLPEPYWERWTSTGTVAGARSA
jgi:DNA-binding transcriptional LysR family regulator